MADLAAARREAEEALRRHDTAHWSERGGEDNVYPCITALRALLAALPAEGEGKTCPGCGGLGWIPAGDEQWGCIDCNGTGHAPAPQPAPHTGIPGHTTAQAWHCAKGGDCPVCEPNKYAALPPEVEAAAEHRVEDKHRCCLDLLRSARLYFADGHPMRLAIERTLAERPGRSSACAAKGGE